MKRAIMLAAAAAAAVAVAGCGSGKVDVTGKVQVISFECTSEELPASVQPGEQVTVTNGSGTVLGSGTLGSAHVVGSVLGEVKCDLPFSVQVPSQSLYGVKLADVTGTTWSHRATGVMIYVQPADGL